MLRVGPNTSKAISFMNAKPYSCANAFANSSHAFSFDAAAAPNTLRRFDSNFVGLLKTPWVSFPQIGQLSDSVLTFPMIHFSQK